MMEKDRSQGIVDEKRFLFEIKFGRIGYWPLYGSRSNVGGVFMELAFEVVGRGQDDELNKIGLKGIEYSK